MLFRVRKGNGDGKSKGQRCSPTRQRGLAQGQGKRGFEVQPRSGFGNLSHCALQLPVESHCSEEEVSSRFMDLRRSLQECPKGGPRFENYGIQDENGQTR